MIFSEQVQRRTDARLTNLLEKAGPVKRREILSRLDRARTSETADVVFAVRWILANSPLSDLANYDFDLFLNCARHGVFLREHSPFSASVPEDIFLHYVLHIRVNEEELCDCRRFFYEKLWDRICAMPAQDAILETNYWNAEHVTYQATSERTISALGAYHSGFGRCGEESNFAVNVFRAVGIPARQIYTPRWAHCDDNHAWVEVYCDGAWHFLGACEPEEVLNRGWFTSASSRAMVIHSRCFGEYSGEEKISTVGMATFLNNLKLYARTTTLTVLVRDSAARPVPGAEVRFEILNECEMFPAAVMQTDAEGRCALTCGLGTMGIHVRKDGIFCEKLVCTQDTDTVELVLARQVPAWNRWEEFRVIAPRDSIVSGCRPTQAQKDRCREKTAAANALREKRAAAMFDAERAAALTAQYGYSREIYDLLRESRENAGRLMEFLGDEAYAPAEKQALLLTLSRKDRRDVDPAVLREALEVTAGLPGPRSEAFYRYIVCPRVAHEPLRPNRRFLLSFFSEAQKDAFRTDPAAIWAYIREQIGFDPSVEYGQILTLPAGALTVRNASPLSCRILFVSICRALGIAARLNPVDGTAQYAKDGTFLCAEEPAAETCTLIFEKSREERWQYGPDFGLSVLEDGAYRGLNLRNNRWDGARMTVTLAPGTYRILTDNRLPNGDIHAGKYDLQLCAGETAAVRLHTYEASLSQMLADFALEEFTVRDADGREVTGTELTQQKAVLCWLDEGAEPTEHILNEMLEQQEAFAALPARIIFLVRSPAALENEKIAAVLRTFPDIRVCYDSFSQNVETLARRMYVDPEKLPLILVATGPLNAVYACSGYHVGSGLMILRICAEF